MYRDSCPLALRHTVAARGVAYEYTTPAMFHEGAGEHIGMVAQDVETVFPSWVDDGEDGYKRVTFRGFEAVTVEAIRELDAQVIATRDATLARIEEIERENAELRKIIETLGDAVLSLQRR